MAGAELPYFSLRDLYPDIGNAWASADERTIPEAGEREGYGEADGQAPAGASRHVTTKDMATLAGWLLVIVVLLVFFGWIT